MQCPRCTAHIPVHPDELVDTPTGLVAVVDWRFDAHEHECACGWSLTVASGIGPHERKGVA